MRRRYDLALENHTLIGRTVEPTAQDPLDPNGVQEGGVEIKNGTLQVTLGYFGGDMGHATFTFPIQGGRFALIAMTASTSTLPRIVRSVSVNYGDAPDGAQYRQNFRHTDKVTRTNCRQSRC